MSKCSTAAGTDQLDGWMARVRIVRRSRRCPLRRLSLLPGQSRLEAALTRAGYRRVQEMIGGFECWAREGLACQTANGRTRRPVDELTAPVIA
ncbi:MAG: sulfurtransferase [Frankiales bacterium]|nr:sulfurtransferase [Frankiales bacterium]